MLKKLMVILIITFPVVGFSQNNESETSDIEVFVIAEKMPEFMGGKDSMLLFISKNIRYPLEAKEDNIQGRVFVNFVVGADGSIRDAKILRGVHKLLDNEALRVVKSMPKWNPGEMKGKKVAVSYNLPVSFKL